MGIVKYVADDQLPETGRSVVVQTPTITARPFKFDGSRFVCEWVDDPHELEISAVTKWMYVEEYQSRIGKCLISFEAAEAHDRNQG